MEYRIEDLTKEEADYIGEKWLVTCCSEKLKHAKRKQSVSVCWVFCSGFAGKALSKWTGIH